MKLDVDYIIDLIDQITETSKEEMGEQDAAPAAGSTGGGNIPKWADSYPLKRGKSNMLWKSGEKWSTGLTRGSANQIW
jgi:hypothetical protein